MRTTVTLDDDVAAAVTERSRERGESFTVALNETLRAGLGMPSRPRSSRMPSRALGMQPDVSLDRALSLAAALEA